MNMQRLGRSHGEQARKLREAGDDGAAARLKENGGDLAERLAGAQGRRTFEAMFDRHLEGDCCVDCGTPLPQDGIRGARFGDRCPECYQAMGKWGQPA